MRSRERVLAALAHQPTDRVPIDITHGQIFPELEGKLRLHFEVRDPEAIRLALGIDLRWLRPIYLRPEEARPDAPMLNWFGATDGLLIGDVASFVSWRWTPSYYAPPGRARAPRHAAPRHPPGAGTWTDDGRWIGLSRLAFPPLKVQRISLDAPVWAVVACPLTSAGVAPLSPVERSPSRRLPIVEFGG